MDRILGIHHVTAIASDARRNISFYRDLLGLRLVKRSVNQDDPGTYHFYYGDERGRPGTIMTFFPWQGIRRGRIGTGQVAATAFSIPRSSLGWWIERLGARGVDFKGPERRFEDTVLRFPDPDGLMLELVAHPDPGGTAWAGGPVPAAHGIRGFHGVTLWVDEADPSARVLTATLGLVEGGRDGTLTRFCADGEPGPGLNVDLRHAQGFPRGLMGGGVVHHVAWRVTDNDAELRLRERIIAAGMHPTPPVERFYFRSVYFHEPGGILFELATDGPGFDVDEPLDQLGSTLKLPPWLEGRRAEIEEMLPRLDG